MTAPAHEGTLALRGSVLTFNDDPSQAAEADAISYWGKGVVVVEDGLIAAVGDYETIGPTLAEDISIVDYGDDLILPGFIDAHVHYPQIGIIASYGAKLIDWLNNYTFLQNHQPSEYGEGGADSPPAASARFFGEGTRGPDEISSSTLGVGH